jgi:hypothetical protein
MRAISLAVALAICLPSYGQRVEPSFSVAGHNEITHAPSPRSPDRTRIPRLISLSAAAVDAEAGLKGLLRWNADNRLPLRNGFTRTVDPIQVRIHVPRELSGGGDLTLVEKRDVTVWSGSVFVREAERLRIWLRDVRVPLGTRFWVYGEDGVPLPFGPDLVDDRGELFSPTVEGETIYLEVEVPGFLAATFTVGGIVQIASTGFLPPSPTDVPSCLIDATCVSTSTFDSIGLARSAVAQLQFMKDGDSYVCTGGLITDRAHSKTPYLLTANHCFSTHASATSLEAFWDYKSPSCGGQTPTFGSLPRSNGAQLLATSPVSDFTFVRLNSIPPNRGLFGWDARPGAVSSGTTVHRVSHPFPELFSVPAAQRYSSGTVNTVTPTCTGRPRTSFLYTSVFQGGLYGGSSGSPLILSGGLVVGQLAGGCGPDPASGCDARNDAVDGSFAVTYEHIASWLEAGSGGTPAPCVPGNTTACMLNGRFKVTVRYRPAFDNQPASTNALVKSVTGFANAAFETGFFYFNDPNNVEMMVKVLDQGNTNAQGQRTIAVLFGSATPLRIEVEVTDSVTGAVKRYTSEFGQMMGATDFTAFVK